jgi:hypothetical protein
VVNHNHELLTDGVAFLAHLICCSATPTYPPLIPHTQVFNYITGIHDVWILPEANCDFNPVSGAELVGPATESSYRYNVLREGIIHFGCSIVGHCEAGMLLTVMASKAEFGGNDSKAASPPPPPPRPEGSCSEPEALEGGLVFVSCLSPPVMLAPGDVSKCRGRHSMNVGA